MIKALSEEDRMKDDENFRSIVDSILDRAVVRHDIITDDGEPMVEFEVSELRRLFNIIRRKKRLDAVKRRKGQPS